MQSKDISEKSVEGLYEHLGPPSESYQEAKNSGVYRLSELMFGSLLAAYVLGFIGSSGYGHAPGGRLDELFVKQLLESVYSYWFPNQSVPYALSIVLQVVDYLCVSLTFSYLTATLYVAYHAGVLPMPQLPLHRLKWDYVVALSQAICFGVSMISPRSFPLMVGLTVVLALWRQYYESHQLLLHICEYRLKLGVDEPESNVPKRELRGSVQTGSVKVQKDVQGRISQERGAPAGGRGNLRGWAKPSQYTWVGIAFVCLLGLFFVVEEPVWHVNGIIHILVALVFILQGHKELGRRGPLLVGGPSEEVMKDLDGSAKDLAEDLIKVFKGTS